MATNRLADQIADLDGGLFSYVQTQSVGWDARALLALHAAAADVLGQFSYLEIGSYLGGSLQALMRDARCRNVISIDLRPSAPVPDARLGSWEYRQNTTQHMLDLLRELPGVDMAKLTTFDAATDTLRVSDLGAKPDYCYIDGEHTHEVVLRDAQFCAEALDGAGVIAFHDYYIVGSAISAFVREHWREISFALAFSATPTPYAGNGVLALELGGRGLLRHPVIERAIGSRWHTAAWKAANWPRRSSFPFQFVCATMPAVDSFIAIARHGLEQYVRRSVIPASS